MMRKIEYKKNVELCHTGSRIKSKVYHEVEIRLRKEVQLWEGSSNIEIIILKRTRKCYCKQTIYHEKGFNCQKVEIFGKGSSIDESFTLLWK